MSSSNRSTETVTLTKDQLQAILQLVTQFGGINVSESGHDHDGNKGGTSNVQQYNHHSPSIAFVEPMSKEENVLGHQNVPMGMVNSRTVVGTSSNFQGHSWENNNVNQSTNDHGGTKFNPQQLEQRRTDHPSSIIGSTSMITGQLRSDIDELNQVKFNHSKNQPIDTPMAHHQSSGRKQFPGHSSNLDLTQSNLFPSNISPQMSSSFSAHQLNVHGQHQQQQQQQLAYDEKASMTRNNSFRRCNRITGDSESTEYEMRRQKMAEYQLMLDEQRMEKEKRQQEEKERRAAEEAILEARYERQQERMRKEYEEEQLKMMRKKEYAERKRMAVVEAIQNTPIVRRRKAGGNGSEGAKWEQERKDGTRTADTISIVSLDGGLSLTTTSSGNNTGSTFTLGTIGSDNNKTSDGQNRNSNIFGLRKSSSMKNLHSQGYSDSVGQLVSGQFNDTIIRRQEDSHSKDAKIKRRGMVQKLSTSLSSSSSPSVSSASSSNSSSLVTQVLVQTQTQTQTVDTVTSDRDGNRRIETAPGTVNGSMMNNSSVNANGGKDGMKMSKGRQDSVRMKEVSVQTEIQLLYSWLDELNQSSNSKSSSYLKKVLEPRRNNSRTSNSSMSQNKSMSRINAQRSASTPRRLPSSVSSSSKSPSPPLFPYKDIKGQVKSKWYRDPNHATWKPVGDVITRNELTTKGSSKVSKVSNFQPMVHHQPLIRPRYGRKYATKRM